MVILGGHEKIHPLNDEREEKEDMKKIQEGWDGGGRRR